MEEISEETAAYEATKCEHCGADINGKDLENSEPKKNILTGFYRLYKKIAVLLIALGIVVCGVVYTVVADSGTLLVTGIVIIVLGIVVFVFGKMGENG